MVRSDDVLQRVAQSAHLREGPAGVESFLRQLYRESPLPTGELARRLGWPVPVTAAVRGELERAGLVARTPGGIALSAAGQSLAHEALGLATQEDPSCPTCAGRRIPVDPARWAPLLARLEAVHRRNPTVDTTLDQSHGTPETALRRALALYREGALEGKDVLLLGDDDLVAVAIGLLALPPTPLSPSPEGAGVRARHVVVLDMDPRFLHHIAAAGQEYGFPVETVEHDLRRPLPAELRTAFDTVETDPPYTPQGVHLFLSRALQALRPGGGRDIFLSYAARDPVGQCALLQVCVTLGLAPYSITPDFNRYAGAGTLGGSSQLLHLRTTAETRRPADRHYSGMLYTKEEDLAIRNYRCRSCGTVLPVGPGETYTTIEALKAQGCPHCGGRRFHPGRRFVPSDRHTANGSGGHHQG